jgi:hypothetical protein
MAIPAKEMGRLLAKDLDEMFRAVDNELRTTWAVYTEFNHKDWRYDIIDIVPWVDRNYDSNPFKIEGAIDEMAAYKKFIEGHK